MYSHNSARNSTSARAVNQRARKQQSALHAARELGAPALRLRGEVEEVEQLVCPAPRLAAADPVVPRLVDEDLLGVDEPVEVDVLLGEPDESSCFARVVVVSEDADLSRRR